MRTATRATGSSYGGLGAAAMGRRPENRRQWLVKALWSGIWLVFLSAPVIDLLEGGHGPAAQFLGWSGLAVFVAGYLTLVFRTGRSERNGTALLVLALLCVESGALVLVMGREWLVLFVYVAIASGAALPLRLACWTIPGASALMAGAALIVPDGKVFLVGLLVPALLGGFAMTGVRELVRTTIALREARATVAQLAANEERLRLARDLHDLLGHSLSLITLKSELAGRMLPGQPELAARQVADIEQVSRQAMTDVREAVSGYRRPRLGSEIAGARVALAAAGVHADLPAEPGLADVPEESESALAWALREAVTNVVRHSGAGRCTVELLRRRTVDGRPVLELSVEDDGSGGPAPHGDSRYRGDSQGDSRYRGGPPGDSPYGNGLTGLTERLHAAGGALEAGPTGQGFRLVARAPLAEPEPHAADTNTDTAADPETDRGPESGTEPGAGSGADLGTEGGADPGAETVGSASEPGEGPETGSGARPEQGPGAYPRAEGSEPGPVPEEGPETGFGAEGAGTGPEQSPGGAGPGARPDQGPGAGSGADVGSRA